MLPPPSEPQPTGASVAVGGAVFAASAMLTGLALRNKSPLPLAAGLAAAAAAAGLSMMKKSKAEGAEAETGMKLEVENETPVEVTATAPSPLPASASASASSCLPVAGCPSKFQILDDDEGEEEEAREDWVDADAVVFTSQTPVGIMPPLAAAILPSHATSFPLLDDDGNVMAGHQMLPLPMPAALAESAEEFGFPLGPLIWEPETEDSVQICGMPDPDEDFLWFGTRRAALPAPSHLAQEIAVPMPGAMPPPALTILSSPPAVGQNWPSGPCASFQLTESPAPESVAAILESLRMEAARRGETASFTPSMQGMAQQVPHPATASESLSFADWMLATQLPSSATTAPPAPVPSTAGQPDFRIARSNPRNAGEKPKFQRDDSHPGSPASQAATAGCDQPHRPSLVYHRSVAPMAPFQQEEGEESGGDRPLTLILAVLILTMTLLVVAIWGHGYRPRNDSPPAPWTQEPATVKERSTASAVPER